MPIPGCTAKMASYKDWCPGHYRQRRAGEQLRPLRARTNIRSIADVEALSTRVGDCWRYRAADTYGRVEVRGRSWRAHRLSYFLATGEDIPGDQIHHKCSNAWCVNPEHLQPASAAENNLEMLARKSYEARIAALEARVKELEAQLENRLVA